MSQATRRIRIKTHVPYPYFLSELVRQSGQHKNWDGWGVTDVASQSDGSILYTWWVEVPNNG